MKPSRTLATSLSAMVAPFTVRTGNCASPAMVLGEPFMLTVYSVPPILAVPPGRIRFCVLMAAITSCGVMPLDCKAARSRSTEITRFMPP